MKARNRRTKNRWSLSVKYPAYDGTIAETFAVGATKQQTLDRWFLQFYCGSVPSGARMPKNIISTTWTNLDVKTEMEGKSQSADPIKIADPIKNELALYEKYNGFMTEQP